MFDRYQAGEQAVLVHIDFTDEHEREDLRELEMLVDSAGVQVEAVVRGSRKAPHPKYFVGGGKAEEIAQVVTLHEANIIIFNHALSPAQERNLETLCKCRVLSRTGLILDIFAQRARTHEGKLQVELAQLRHISTRLVRGWTHLERQKGGIGMRGPGETQLESDRRLIRGRIDTILKRLGKVSRQREQGRRSRRRAEVPTISLVGYTNAGKSTLFNRITEAGVYAADQLFATLDPTLRKIDVADVGPTILADTVGFIRHLPHDLVAAFKATLQETQEAELLLHVYDGADDRFAENIDQVKEVLDEIDAGDVPVLMICNKIDLLEGAEPRIDRDENGLPWRVWVSAQKNLGIDLLFQALTERLGRVMVEYTLCIPPAEGRLRGILYQKQVVQNERYTEQGDSELLIRMPKNDWSALLKREFPQAEQYIISEEKSGETH